MEVVYPRCCGLDLHRRTVVACLLTPGPRGKPTKAVRTFGTMTDDLLACDQSIERTFAWLLHSRRLARAYERLTAADEALIYATMTRLMARRLARMGP